MIKKRKTGFLFLCGFFVWSLSVSAFGAVDSARSAADYFSERKLDEEDGYTVRGTEDEGHGPGITAAASVEEESQGETGPKIHDVTMGEKYHEEFGLYEQSLNNQYFLYSNVENGGITDQPVYVDIPADLIFTMEKDGVPMTYSSKQRVGENGTYVLRITAIYDKNVPLSEQEEYRSVFRFRIDDKAPAAAAEEGGNGGAGLPDGLGANWASVEEGDIIGPNGETAGSEGESEPAAGETESEAPDGEAEPETLEEETKPDETGGALTEESKTTRVQTYDKTKNLYRIVFSNGFAFSSNVPENMITSSAVRLTLDKDSSCQLYRGEEEVPWEADTVLTEYGQYRLVSGEGEFRFEITNTYVNRSEFKAPVGTEITGITFNDETLRLTDRYSFAMTEDGKYTISLTGEGGEQHRVILNRDTAPPEFTVAVERQKAAIIYLADDMAAITLKKGGEEPKPFSSTVVTAPGRYVLTVTDRAGNESSQEFTLRYHLNAYAVTAILLIVAGIAGGVVFLTRKKRNLGVR